MTRANLALMPAHSGVRPGRRVVSLTAQRPAGAQLCSTRIIKISAEGFLGETARPVAMGTLAWIQLPGVVPVGCQAVGLEDGHTRCAFIGRLPADAVEQVIAAGRKPLRKGHFGPQRA